MKANFQGELAEGVIANLFQYLSLNRASGQLQVRHRSGQVGNTFFEEGRLVHATSGDERGIPAIAQMLQWTDGRFGFRASVAPPERTIKLSLDSLLLQAAYQADLSTSTPVSLNGHTMLVPSTDDEQFATVSLSLRALHVMRHLDAKTPLDEVAAALGISLSEVVAASQELLRQGIVSIAQGEVVDSEFVAEITQVSLSIMGPVANIIVEDTLYDLGLTPDRLFASAIPEFITALQQQFPSDKEQRSFEARARRLCREYGIEV